MRRSDGCMNVNAPPMWMHDQCEYKCDQWGPERIHVVHGTAEIPDLVILLNEVNRFVQ